MEQFIYEGFACVSACKDEIVFSNERSEIKIEYKHYDCIPMKKYDFTFIVDKNGKYQVSSFEKDKFDKFYVKLISTETNRLENAETITICVHLDAYNKEDMPFFKRGVRFNMEMK